MSMRWMSAVGCLLLTACAGSTVPMKRSRTVPAAQGELRVEQRGRNTQIHVRTEHLAPAPRVAPGANEYVVWIRPLGAAGGPRNAGSLDVGEDLESSLMTVTPHEQFEVFLTPEPNGEVNSPSGPRVLWAHVR